MSKVTWELIDIIIITVLVLASAWELIAASNVALATYYIVLAILVQVRRRDG